MLFEELSNSKPGDQVLVENPIFGEIVYVLLSELDNQYFFINQNGSSLSIKDQKTINSFNVRLINKDHPKWNSELFNYGFESNRIIDESN